MANGQHGGYRRPENPAPVSGPGAASRRTDGGIADKKALSRELPDAKYGEQQDFGEIQAGAPMNAAPLPQAVPLGAPTNRPDEPVTAGNPLGPGIGPMAAGVSQAGANQQDAEALVRMLPLLEFVANQPGSAPSTRSLVRQIRAYL